MTNTKHSSVFRGSISYIAKLTLPSSQLLCLVLCDSLGPCGNNLPCQVSCVVDFPDLVLLSTSGFFFTKCGSPGACGNHLPCQPSLVVNSSGGTSSVVLFIFNSIASCCCPGAWGNHLPCQPFLPGVAPNGTCTRCTSLEMSGGDFPIFPSFSSGSRVGSNRLACDFLMDFASMRANPRHKRVK